MASCFAATSTECAPLPIFALRPTGRRSGASVMIGVVSATYLPICCHTLRHRLVYESRRCGSLPTFLSPLRTFHNSHKLLQHRTNLQLPEAIQNMRATMLLFTLECYITLFASSTPSAQPQITLHRQTNSCGPLWDQWSKRQESPPSPHHPMRPATAFWDDDFASPADFQKAADKGGALICALLGSDRTAGLLLKDKRNPPSAASIWTGDLKTSCRSGTGECRIQHRGEIS
jgi:hypothetical protein